MTSFSEQYKSPQWQKRRLERLNAAGWECMECEDKEAQLHVHHTRYIAGRKIWEYSDEELKVLCDACHDSAHHQKNALLLIAGRLSKESLDEVMAYACTVAAFSDFGNEGAYRIHVHNASHIEGVANKVRVPDEAVLNVMKDGVVSLGELLADKDRMRGKE